MTLEQPTLERAAAKKTDRLRIRTLLDTTTHEALAHDVRDGLRGRPKSLPPKYFYDEAGSRLFERICETDEYYQTRTEQGLLEVLSDDLVNRTQPTEVIELGSGSAKKTRAILDAVQRADLACRYVPFDVSASMLQESAERLLKDYPWLCIQGIVGDYERHLEALPSGSRRWFLFLGSTIGNFDPPQTVQFLRRLRQRMSAADWLLIGFDTVKDVRVLNAAYNDRAGVTAAFNKNVLSVINRELDADFDLDNFAHVAFFNSEQSQIEMYLEAKRMQQVHIEQLDMSVEFASKERILTEISRKFTQPTATATLHSAGLELDEWLTPDDESFALALCRVQ